MCTCLRISFPFPVFDFKVSCVFGRSIKNCSSQHLCPQENCFLSSLAKGTLALRTHFGNGRNQIRRGTAKQKKADCNGLMSRVNQEKLTAGGRTLVHRSCGMSLSIPVN